jgi:antitoxin CptB
MGGGDGARIRWRCRRGVKELDILMERFVAARLPDLPPALLADLDLLLDESDPDLLDWIMGRAPPSSARYAPLIAMLRALHELPR